VIAINETASGVTFAIKVQPRSKRNAILGELGDAFKVALTAPPVDGKANQACVEFFSGILRVPRSAVMIAAGETSRNKVIRVLGISAALVRERLKVERK
jgi:uncharacterized protein (TIGR00251 family)